MGKESIMDLKKWFKEREDKKKEQPAPPKLPTPSPKDLQVSPTVADVEFVDILGKRIELLNELLLRREKLETEVKAERCKNSKTMAISPIERAYNSLCVLIDELSRDITIAIKEGGGKQQLIVKVDSDTPQEQ